MFQAGFIDTEYGVHGRGLSSGLMNIIEPTVTVTAGLGHFEVF